MTPRTGSVHGAVPPEFIGRARAFETLVAEAHDRAIAAIETKVIPLVRGWYCGGSHTRTALLLPER